MSGMIFHVWFATRRRKWLLLGDVEQAVKEWLHRAAKEKGIDLLACETAVDHVHLLLRSTGSEELPNALRLLKGRTSREVFRKFPELKLDASTNSLWQRSYAFKEVEPSSIRDRLHYIRSQKDRLGGFAERRCSGVQSA